MSITLGSNIASLNSQRRLADGTALLSKTFERLSSGQRINKASDDAAGLSIADSLSAQSRIFNQGVRNLKDGLSLFNIADSAIESLSSIVIRLEELAEQSANGVYSNKQRKALDAEAQALSKEFFRISKTTDFNSQRLLTGEFDAVNLQAGVGEKAVLSAGVGGAIGTGEFKGASNSFSISDLGDAAEELAVGDLNGDGFSDVVSAVYGSSGASFIIAFGNSNGTLSPVAEIPIGFGLSGTSINIGDTNNDGILDLQATIINDGARHIVTALGQGDGTFGAVDSYLLGSQPTDSALGDINNDGILDLVASYSNTLDIRLGTGDGTFAGSSTYQTVGISYNTVELGDVNGDGSLDLISGGSSGGSGTVEVRLGDGSGGFSAPITYAEGGSSRSDVRVADLNNDSHLDLLSSGGAGVGYISVRINLGDGTFGATTSYQMDSSFTYAVKVGDLNGDGLPDLVGAGTSGSVTLRLGNGDGTFGASSAVSMLSSALDVQLADINGDGVPDLLASGRESGLEAIAYITASTVAGVSPLLPFSLTTLAGARQALPVFKRKREQLATQRGEIGAFQSRIDVAANLLTVSSENFKTAESRIRDSDIAEESSNLVRLNILQQAASSVLAQANQQPALALQLLSNRN